MLPVWSLNGIPLVFIILYGLLRLLFQKPLVCSQGADISLRTISIVFPASSLSFLPLFPVGASSRGLSTPNPVAITASGVCESGSSDVATSSCWRGRPLCGSLRNCLISAWTSFDKKFPWIVDTPFGGWAGMISIPTIRPLGLVRSTATCD